jgi:plasmid stabilization system protein ParE
LRRVVWTPGASRDLAEAVAYRAEFDVEAAERFRARVLDAAKALGGIPTGHPGRRAGTFEKSLPRLRYILVYTVDAAPGLVEIIRLIHASREWPENLWPE